jgi:hypothetical protein
MTKSSDLDMEANSSNSSSSGCNTNTTTSISKSGDEEEEEESDLELEKLSEDPGMLAFNQCCGSGSGIDALLIPGSGMGKKLRAGSGIRDVHPGSYYLELGNNFLG